MIGSKANIAVQSTSSSSYYKKLNRIYLELINICYVSILYTILNKQDNALNEYNPLRASLFISSVLYPHKK